MILCRCSSSILFPDNNIASILSILTTASVFSIPAFTTSMSLYQVRIISRYDFSSARPILSKSESMKVSSARLFTMACRLSKKPFSLWWFRASPSLPAESPESTCALTSSAPCSLISISLTRDAVNGKNLTDCDRDLMVGKSAAGVRVISIITESEGGSSSVLRSAPCASWVMVSASSIMYTFLKASYGLSPTSLISARIWSIFIWAPILWDLSKTTSG